MLIEIKPVSLKKQKNLYGSFRGATTTYVYARLMWRLTWRLTSRKGVQWIFWFARRPDFSLYYCLIGCSLNLTNRYFQHSNVLQQLSRTTLKFVAKKNRTELRIYLRCSDLVKLNITMKFCYAFLLLFSVMRTTTTQISAMRWCCSLLWEQQRNNDAMLFSNENVVLKILNQNNASRNLEPKLWFLNFIINYSIHLWLQIKM